MKNLDAFYDIFPKILPCGRRVTVRIHPCFEHVRFGPEVTYSVRAAERETRTISILTCQLVDGDLLVDVAAEREQEYVLLIDAAHNGEQRRLLEIPLYALDEDLYVMRPWKGDFHIHSCRSDGRESPVFVGAACREIGMDFMALTDHRQYRPSLEVIEAFEGTSIDLTICPGEEIHAPGNPVHIVNFGGAFSVNAKFDNSGEYEAEVTRLSDLAPDGITGEERHHFASCIWVFDEIRKAHGIGVLCHPYWITGEAHNISSELQQALYERKPFDALEIIGGFYRHQMEANALAVSRWQEERSRGLSTAVVGVSDAHGCNSADLFGWYYTLVFAPSPQFPDIRQGILGEKCVAVEAVPGEFPRVYGPFRLVKFAYYCLREILPLHDALCAGEGILMKEFLAGRNNASTRLADSRGQVNALYHELWASGNMSV